MSEFMTEHRGDSLARTFMGSKYKKIYKLVEVTKEELESENPPISKGSMILFTDDYDKIITFNGNMIQYVVDITIDSSTGITNFKTVPYVINNIYSNVEYPPFQ